MRRDQECSLRRIATLQRNIEIAGGVGGGGKSSRAAGLRDQIMRELFAFAIRRARDADRVVRLLRERIEQLRRKRKVRLRCDGGCHVKPEAFPA